MKRKTKKLATEQWIKEVRARLRLTGNDNDVDRRIKDIQSGNRARSKPRGQR